MKKLIIATSLVALCAVTTYAQDSTRSTQEPRTQQSDQLRKEDMKGWTQVQASDVPSNLRTTLGGTQYTGWESGTVYKNEAGDTYMVRTGNSSSAGAQKTYYFDKNGKETKKPGKKDY